MPANVHQLTFDIIVQLLLRSRVDPCSKRSARPRVLAGFCRRRKIIFQASVLVKLMISRHLADLTRRRPSRSASSFLISSFNLSILDSFDES